MGPVQKEWVEALRSGKYKQCKGRLTDGVGYCCLGVAAEVCLPLDKNRDTNVYFDQKNIPITQSLSSDSFKDLGLHDESGGFKVPKLVVPNPITESKYAYSLIDLNDNLWLDFNQIADFIEANEDIVFKEEV